MLKVSIVIPTKERPQDLKTCFDSFVQQDYKNFEVVIVDGSVSPDTKRLCDTYGGLLAIQYVKQKTKGCAGAIRDSLPYISGDIFTRTDDDIIASPTWLQEIVTTFQASDSTGGVTGPTLIPQDRLESRDLIKFNLQLRDSRGIFWRILRKIYHGYLMEGQPFAICRFFKSGVFSLGSGFVEYLDKLRGHIEVDYLESCNWSVRNSLLCQINNFDPRFIGVGDYFEADAVYKIKGLGYKMIFNPKANIRHMVSIAGAFGARSHSYARSRNFVLFYYSHIKPNTFDKTLRFLTYLLFMNSYFVLCFLKTADVMNLSGIWGTIDGMIRYIPELLFYKDKSDQRKP